MLILSDFGEKKSLAQKRVSSYVACIGSEIQTVVPRVTYTKRKWFRDLRAWFAARTQQRVFYITRPWFAFVDCAGEWAGLSFTPVKQHT